MALIDDMKKQSKVFQAFIDATAELERIGSLENHAKELDKELASLAYGIEKANGTLESVNNEIKLAASKKSEAYAKAKASHDQMLKDAEAKADGIVADAKDAAAKIVAAANDAALSASAELDAVRKATVVANEELSSINAEIAAAVAERTSIEKATGSLKQKLANLLG